jgi:hypothetical protein
LPTLRWAGIFRGFGPAGFLFNGALSTYVKLGVVRDRKIGKHPWVVKVVESTSWGLATLGGHSGTLAHATVTSPGPG